jgi:hypothetical protein
LRRRWKCRSWGRSAESLSLADRELERQVPPITVNRSYVVCDLRVEKTFLAHLVSKHCLEAAKCLVFQRPPQAEVSAVCPEPFAAFLPSGSRQVELFGANDLDACNDVMSLYW